MLALTPLVFVTWEDRYQALVKKYGRISFKTLGQAMEAPGGRGTIADHPEWRTFHFGHPDPDKSNGGVMLLVLMGYEYHPKTRRLTPADVADPVFQAAFKSFEQHIPVVVAAGATPLMDDMVRKGPPATTVSSCTKT